MRLSTTSRRKPAAPTCSARKTSAVPPSAIFRSALYRPAAAMRAASLTAWRVGWPLLRRELLPHEAPHRHGGGPGGVLAGSDRALHAALATVAQVHRQV